MAVRFIIFQSYNGTKMHSLNYSASYLQYKLRELNAYEVGTVR